MYFSSWERGTVCATRPAENLNWGSWIFRRSVGSLSGRFSCLSCSRQGQESLTWSIWSIKLGVAPFLEKCLPPAKLKQLITDAFFELEEEFSQPDRLISSRSLLWLSIPERKAFCTNRSNALGWIPALRLGDTETEPRGRVPWTARKEAMPAPTKLLDPWRCHTHKVWFWESQPTWPRADPQCRLSICFPQGRWSGTLEETHSTVRLPLNCAYLKCHAALWHRHVLERSYNVSPAPVTLEQSSRATAVLGDSH